jgi:hypothetical protein
MGNLITLPDMTARERPERFHVAFSFAGEQRVLVRAIAEAVEKLIGMNNVFLDEWFEYLIAGHDADLRLQEIYGTQCDLVVVCVSERYGTKSWTQAEHEAIRARLMQSRASEDPRERDGVLPIRVGDGDVKGILFNTIVPDVRDRTPDAAAQLIVARLKRVVPGSFTAAGSLGAEASWPEMPSPMVWPMADHSSVREAFVSLLHRQAAWRFLPIVGSSETGKTHITGQMLANALRTSGLACGRLDFKGGGTGMDAELRAFVQFLDVPLPPANVPLNERLGHILDALKKRARPTLVVFDTYESAGEAQDWVEKQLLPCLIRALWLRVVVAGQHVPEPAGAVWASAARQPLRLVPPPPADWLEYSKEHHPDLTLDKVEYLCGLARNKAGLLAQLLGTVT